MNSDIVVRYFAGAAEQSDVDDPLSGVKRHFDPAGLPLPLEGSPPWPDGQVSHGGAVLV